MSDQHDEIASQRALRELRAQWQSALDADNATLDTDITARLEQARQHALSTSPRRQIWTTASAVAAMLLVVALPLSQHLRHENAAAPLSAVDLDVSEVEPWQEDAELLDDLDFYTWLELEAQHAS